MTTVRPNSKENESDAPTCAVARTASVLECVVQGVGVGIGCAETAVCTKDVFSMTPAVDTPSRSTYQLIACCLLFTALIVRVIRATRNAFSVALIQFTPENLYSNVGTNIKTRQMRKHGTLIFAHLVSEAK